MAAAGVYWVVYDKEDRPCRVVQSASANGPNISKWETRKVLLSSLSEQDQKDIRILFLEPRTGTGKRRRGEGHGYFGGDGFVDL